MLEESLRELFDQQTAAARPPVRASIGQAVTDAAALRRRRQLVAIASPVLAAAAVIGVVAGGALVGADHDAGPVPPGSGSTAAPTSSPTQASPPVATGSLLNPLQIPLTFGWLPAGQHIGNIGTGRTWMFINAGAGWTLGVYARGQCRLRPIPAKSGHVELSCAGGILGTGESAPIVSSAREVQGHRAYWLGAPGPYLAWQYAPASWATLEYPTKAPSRHRPQKFPKSALAVKVAGHTIVGPAATPIRFPAQLTGAPASWQVSSTDLIPKAGILAADLYQITSGPMVLAPDGAGVPQNTPQISIVPARPHTANNTCSFSGGHPAHQVIGGYAVQTVSIPRQHLQELCAADADGLFVYIYLAGSHPALSASRIFAHLHLLGTNPANWTTKPIG